VLLHARGPSGATPTVFIETKDLDGETNLKMKSVPKSFAERYQSPADFKAVNGTLTCEPPNEHLYKFEGRAELVEVVERGGCLYQGRALETVPLTPDNVVLRGCKLRNTEVSYGIVVYTGHETKIMRNSLNARYKFSKLEKATNFTILVILCFQCILASSGGLIGALWVDTNGRRRNSYRDCLNFKDFWCSRAYYILDYEFFYMDVMLEFVKMTGTWILIFTNFIPISMLTTLEMVKLGQAYFMQQDANMVDDETAEKMRPQASNLNEELGQIEYVFSDKTGTLTCNVMEFKKFSAGVSSYGTGERQPPEGQEENVNFADD
jgi:phospholipid-transporting ATPase